MMRTTTCGSRATFRSADPSTPDCCLPPINEPENTNQGHARVFGNVMALASGAIAARAVAFIGTAFIARQLGPEGFGIIGFAAAIAGYMSIAVSAGFNDVGAREIARRLDETGPIAAGVTAVRLVLAVGALAITAVVAFALPKPWIVQLVVMLTGLSFVSLALDTSWVYKGLERTRPVALTQITAQAVFVVTALLLVRGPDDVAIVPVAQFLGELVAAVLLGVPLLKLAGRSFPWRVGVDILKSSLPWAVSRLLRTLIYTFDIVLLGVMIGEHQVGIYAAAYRFCFLLVAIAHSANNSYIPVFARAAITPQGVAPVVSRAAELAVALSFPLVIGAMLVAEPLLALLFGNAYAGGATALQILLLSIGLIFLNGPVHNALLVHEKMRAETWIIGVATAVNIAANFLLIPRYGIVGAATATVVAEAIIVLLGSLLLARLSIKPDLRPLIRPVIASVIMALAVAALGLRDNLFLAAGCGALVYVGALILLGAVPRDIRDHLAGRKPGLR